MTGTGLDRRLLIVPALVLVLAGLLGYLTGHGHAQARSREQMLTASVGGMLLDAPSRWKAAATAQEIPGLTLRHPLLLAPGGDPSAAGLLAGALLGGRASPLPGALMARLRQRPSTDVVSLREAQAYRYTGLSVRGFDKSLTAYVVPHPAGDPTALICYATPSQSADMQTCQRIVSTLTLVSQSQSYDLTPQPEYAQRLRAVMTALDAQRVPLRARMGQGARVAELQRLAGGLAHAFAAAAASLSGLETTLATGQAQSTLSGAILQAHAAYRALASAARERSEARFAAARSTVDRAEAGVNAALEGFALLGYRPA